MSNKDNPKNGAIFQEQVMKWFQDHYEGTFKLDEKIPIGDPAKDHKFDIVDEEGNMAIECKRYTWTESGNVPSAKMGFTNEAAFYLTFLPETYEKYIVMLKSYHEKRNESLAEYYYRTNKHLLGNIIVAEYDPETNEMRIIGDRAQKYYYIKDLSIFAKKEGPFRNYLYKDGEWVSDNENIVSDRLIGYDPYEDDDSPYKVSYD